MTTDDDGTPTGAFALTSPKKDALDHEAAGKYPRHVQLMLAQCTINLAGLSVKAAQLWREGR